VELDFMKASHMLSVCFTYLNIRFAAVQCTIVRACRY
jgi:hypothetical protein